MSIQITHVRYGSTSKTHETIVRYQYVANDGTVSDRDKPTLVDWIDNKSGQAHVGSGANRVGVRTVHRAGVNPYLQTHADGKLTNNLLSLPTF